MDTCLRRREAGAMRETIPAWVWMTNDNLNIEPGSQRDVPNKITVGASHDCQIFHVDQSRPQGASSVTSQHYAGNRAPARLSLLMCIPADWHMDSHGFYPSPPRLWHKWHCSIPASNGTLQCRAPPPPEHQWPDMRPRWWCLYKGPHDCSRGRRRNQGLNEYWCDWLSWAERSSLRRVEYLPIVTPGPGH